MVRIDVEKVAKIEGGFVLVSAPGLIHAWHAARATPSGIADFRAWLAAHELVARRCRVHRDRDRSPFYEAAELARLLGTSERRARAAIRRLEAAGLLAWAAGEINFPATREPDGAGPAMLAAGDTIGRGRGSVAIPRRMLRHLVAGARPALIATTLGVLLRCLSRRKGGWDGRGRIKSSWVAKVFGISARKVKTARAELVGLGWIAAEDSGQWALNRWGKAYRIALDWVAPKPEAADSTHPVIGRGGLKTSPPLADPGPVSSPPDSDSEPLRERIQHQEPARGPAGVRIESQAVEEQPLQAPTLNDVQVADLKDTERLLQLHDQAVAKGIVTTAEADRLRVVAAAEHALAIGQANPAGLFAYLIRNRAWRYLTGEDEDRANARIKSFLRGPEPSRSSFVASSSRPIEPGLSEDARIVREIRAAFMRARIYRDPFPTFSAKYPAWDRTRWDRAMMELGLA